MTRGSLSAAGLSGKPFDQSEALQRMEQRQVQILRWIQITAVLVVLLFVVLFVF